MPRGIRFELTPDERMERWRPLAHWAIGIPYTVVAIALIPVVVVLVLVGAVGILSTGRWPLAPARRVVGIHRFQYRVATFVWLLRRELPKVSLAARWDDPGGDPLRFEVAEPTPSGRLTVLTRWIATLPLLVAVTVLSIGGVFATVVGGVWITATGRWPTGLADYSLGLARRQAQLVVYAELLSDEAPRLSTI